jgi:energy-coupling factor transport system ATP-binding protein
VEGRPVRIHLDDIQVSRGAFTLRYRGVFEEGIHLVSGPVGSGKSTLALLLASLITPERGRIQMQGISSTSLSLQFPEYHVTSPTVAGEVRSWGLEPDSILSRSGLLDRPDTDPFHLSRGELKRLNLACVLAGDSDLLLLDEPFSSLDCAAKRKTCRMIEERCDGITILFSHERSILPQVDTIWEMRGGDLQACGPVPEAMREWQSAPQYIRYALSRGVLPANIRLEDAREAVCRIRD